jgi:hypothetical protein
MLRTSSPAEALVVQWAHGLVLDFLLEQLTNLYCEGLLTFLPFA